MSESDIKNKQINKKKRKIIKTDQGLGITVIVKN